MQNRWLIGALLLSACGGGKAAPGAVNPQSAAPVTAEAAVRAFIKAASDSNIAEMSQLFGTDKGSAYSTHQPADFQRKLEVMQIYLRNIQYTVGKIHPADNEPGKTIVDVIIDRKACSRTMPITTVLSAKDGWMVNSLDLNTAGNPSRPCRDAGGDAVAPKQ